MKKIGIVIIVLVISLIGLILARNVITQTAITRGIKKITGVGLRVHSVRVGMLSAFLSLNELKISNPSNFSDKVMADVPQIYVDYSLGDFCKGKVHLQDLKINIRELSVIKNEAGQVNVKSLEALAPKGEGPPPEIQIDTLNLKVGKVIFKDYSLGKVNVREFDVNIDENFKNINDPKALVSLILVRALSKTNIAGLAGIDLGELKESVSKALIEKSDTAIGESLRKIFEPSQQ